MLVKDASFNNARVILFVQITSSGRRDGFFGDENDPGCLGFFSGMKSSYI